MESNTYIDEIPQDIFTNIQEIDSGTFSDIFSAVHLNTNSTVALKILLKNNDEEEMNSLQQEIAINKTLHHPFICKYFTDIETENLNIIVMELIEGDNALNYVNKTRGLSLQKALYIFTQLIIAIQYLHTEAHITHRDLKLENIMIDKYDHIRLIDFGFSSINVMMTTCCGSIPYCAPEIFTGQKYTNTADIWSLGIILYALIDGNLPFYHTNMNTLAAMICQNEVKFTPNFQKDEIIDLIQKMLIKDPEKRIKIDEIKKHPSLSQQRLLQIDYKQLFQSIEEKQVKFTSPKFNEQHCALVKSSTCIQFNTGFRNYQMTNSSSLTNESIAIQNNSNLNENPKSLDDEIRNRKDFPIYLNKAIESALLFSLEMKNIPLRGLKSFSVGSNFNGVLSNCAKRNKQHCRFQNKFQVMQPNVKNNVNFGKDVFDKK